MIRIETIIVRRGLGRRPLLVTAIRRDCRRTRRTGRRMAAAGRPPSWIARALGVARHRVARLLQMDPVWGDQLGVRS